tara:strand:+ start:381 stop:626 length:246 start_codon:yes stop_codon:yes gene_type:complete
MDCTDDTTRGGGLLCHVIFMGMRDTILHILKLVVAVLVGIEVSYPPNPYKEYLIVGLISLIILKNNLDVKIQEVMEKWLWK